MLDIENDSNSTSLDREAPTILKTMKSAVKYILITGGAGYIGSILTHLLRNSGTYIPIVLDTHIMPYTLRDVVHIRGDIHDVALLDGIFEKYPIHAVIHLAAYLDVKESTENPHKYYYNNISGSLSLLDCMIRAGVSRFIFSSSCSVYGNNEHKNISETATLQPVHAYGYSKQFIESLLPEYERMYGLHSATLRLFNVAGAHTMFGESTQNSTHILPRIVHAAHSQQQLRIFGNNHLTPDGTCIRDYVHVLDVARACIQAIQALESRRTSFICNIGNSIGHSVLDILHTTQKVLGKEVPHVIMPKRDGDVAEITANISQSARILDWRPEYTLEDMIVSESLWQRSVTQ